MSDLFGEAGTELLDHLQLSGLCPPAGGDA